jgi:hypothetical protein
MGTTISGAAPQASFDAAKNKKPAGGGRRAQIDLYDSTSENMRVAGAVKRVASGRFARPAWPAVESTFQGMLTMSIYMISH